MAISAATSPTTGTNQTRSSRTASSATTVATTPPSQTERVSVNSIPTAHSTRTATAACLLRVPRQK